MKKTLTAIAIALIAVGTLSGCGSDTDTDTDTGREVVEIQKTLSDGRTITCLQMRTYQYGGGLSCDW